MKTGEILKEALNLINRNWQIIIINIVFWFLSGVGFVCLVVLPMLVFLLIKGLNLSIFFYPETLKELLSSTPETVAVLVVLVVFFFLVVFLAGFYIFAGIMGLLRESMDNPGKTFTLSGFINNANRLFLPMLGFSMAAGAVALGIVLAGAVLFALFTLTVMHLKAISPVAASVVISVSCLLSVIGAVVGVLLFMAVVTYGTVSICINGSGGFRTLKEAKSLLYKNPEAVLVYLIAVSVYLVAGFLLNLTVASLKLLSVSMIVIFIFEFIIAILQIYIMYWVFAVAMLYFRKATVKPQSV